MPKFEDVTVPMVGEDGNVFSIIGRVDGNAAVRLREADVFAPSARLSWDDYRSRASAIHYSLGIADPEPYRLTASGSFLDSLSYVKPGLFLRNRYVEACFERLGDIGYLCDSVDHMVETARTIVSAPPIDRYLAQCENIRRGRGMFSPAAVAGELATLLAEMTAVSESRAHSSALKADSYWLPPDCRTARNTARRLATSSVRSGPVPRDRA